MSLSFSISPASDVPLFRQITQQLHRAVAVGRLKVGEQLPAVRSLAESLVVNPNTVARSYQELIREGILESRSGRGVFVAQRRQVFSDAERTRRLQHSAEQYCHESMLLDAGLPEILTLLEAAWNDLQREVQCVETPSERNL
jgi:GntR family transcriptional regulator